MNYSKAIAGSLASSLGSKGLLLLLNLLLLPILIKFLGAQRAGLWMLIGQSLGFLNVFDFGLTPTLTRRIAFASVHQAEVAGPIGQELAVTLAAGRYLTRRIAIIVIAVALPLGFWVLRCLSLPIALQHEAEMVWLAVVISYAATSWGMHWGCLLRGIGHVTQANMIATGTQVLIVIVQLVLAMLGAGMPVLAIAQGMCFLLGNAAAFWLLRARGYRANLFSTKAQRAVVASLVTTSLKCWLTSLGALLILKTDHYFIAFRCGLEIVPQYQAAYLIVFYVYQIAVNLSAASSVFISKYWIEQRLTEMQAIVLRFSRWGGLVMVLGCLSIITLSPFLFRVWLGNSEFIGFQVICIFAVMLTLEAHHVLFADFSRATDNEVFAISALAAGMLNLVLTWWLSAHWGVVGIALGTLFAQVLTNNWIVVYISINRLQIDWGDYLRQVIKPLAWLLILIAPVAVLKYLMPLSLAVALLSQIWLLMMLVAFLFTTDRPLIMALRNWRRKISLKELSGSK